MGNEKLAREVLDRLIDKLRRLRERGWLHINSVASGSVVESKRSPANETAIDYQVDARAK
jgi:hypothetical protein